MPRIHFIERLAAALVVIATALAWVLSGAPLAAGVGAGGILAVFNIFVLRVLMRAIVTAEHPPRQAGLSIILMLKFAVMGAAVFMLINYAKIDPMGLLLGLTVVVVSIVAGGFRVAMRAAAAAQE